MTYQHHLQPLSMRQRRQLMTDLNPSRVSTRSQGRSSLSYLEAWDVKASLIRIFGFGGFSAEAEDCEIVRIENNVPKVEWKNGSKTVIPIEYAPDGQIVFGTANFRVTARVKVKLTIHQLGATYTEFAASSQTGPDLGEVSDFAIKTAESDALKRAAIYLGTQFGLSLYASDKDHVHYADVVKTVMADGQLWPASPRDLKNEREQFLYDTMQPGHGRDEVTESPEEKGQREVGMLENIVHGQQPGPVMTPFEGGPSTLTPELREQTNALIERGLQMQRANGDPQIDNGPAAVLDPSFDGAKIDDELRARAADEAEAMAAADGHSE